MVLNVCKVSTKGFCNLIFLQRLEEARYSVSCWNLAGSHAALPFPVIHPAPGTVDQMPVSSLYFSCQAIKGIRKRERGESAEI